MVIASLETASSQPSSYNVVESLLTVTLQMQNKVITRSRLNNTYCTTISMQACIAVNVYNTDTSYLNVFTCIKM